MCVVRKRVVGNDIYIEKYGKFYMDFTWKIYNEFTTNLGKLKHIEYINTIRRNVDVTFTTISHSTYFRRKLTITLRRKRFVVNYHGVYDEVMSRRNCVVKRM